jgi:hypothetical protein
MALNLVLKSITGDLFGGSFFCAKKSSGFPFAAFKVTNRLLSWSCLYDNIPSAWSLLFRTFTVDFRAENDWLLRITPHFSLLSISVNPLVLPRNHEKQINPVDLHLW